MIVIVIGMHRSGTSALAGMLHANDILMGRDGDFFPPPQKENPKGFFENKRFRNINDQILRLAGYHVKSFSPAIPDWSKISIPNEIWLKSIELINYYDSNFENWGFKDPRTCLTLHHWLTVVKMARGDLNDVKPILMVRNASDIAQSMMARGNKEKLYPGQFKSLCTVYYGEAMGALSSAKLPYLQLRFNHLIENTKSVADMVGQYLNYPIGDISFVEPKISRTRIGHE